jgi:hypothetical protein
MQAVGSQSEIEPVFSTGEFNPHATYLLCCDGFYNRMHQQDFELFKPSASVSKSDLDLVCSNSVNAVLERGEKDNVSVIAFKAEHPEAFEALRGGGTTCGGDDEADATTVVFDSSEDDMATTVVVDLDDDADSTTIVVDSDDDDNATTVVFDDENDSTTVVFDDDSTPTLVSPKGGANG